MRAAETARIVRPDAAPVLDPRWREAAFGEWEGRRVQSVDPGFDARRYAPPGGETFQQLRVRVDEALRELRSRGGRVLIVTHAGPLHAVLDLYFPRRTMRFDPATITAMRFAPEAQLLCLGLTARQYEGRKSAARASEP